VEMKSEMPRLVCLESKGGGSYGTFLSREAGVCYGTAIRNNIKF